MCLLRSCFFLTKWQLRQRHIPPPSQAIRTSALPVNLNLGSLLWISHHWQELFMLLVCKLLKSKIAFSLSPRLHLKNMRCYKINSNDEIIQLAQLICHSPTYFTCFTSSWWVPKSLDVLVYWSKHIQEIIDSVLQQQSFYKGHEPVSCGHQGSNWFCSSFRTLHKSTV